MYFLHTIPVEHEIKKNSLWYESLIYKLQEIFIILSTFCSLKFYIEHIGEPTKYFYVWLYLYKETL